MKWMALALQIERRNALLNEQCRKLTEQYGHDGFSTCILKGQGNLLNYPEELRDRRQCGDIDLWAVPMNGRQQEQHETTWCQQADYFGEQQFPSIGQQLKEMSPQADGDEWSEISRNGQQLSKNNSCSNGSNCSVNPVIVV